MKSSDWMSKKLINYVKHKLLKKRQKLIPEIREARILDLSLRRTTKKMTLTLVKTWALMID
jgi:hypothetical protein